MVRVRKISRGRRGRRELEVGEPLQRHPRGDREIYRISDNIGGRLKFYLPTDRVYALEDLQHGLKYAASVQLDDDK